MFSIVRERRPAKLRKNCTAQASSSGQLELSMNSVAPLPQGRSRVQVAVDTTAQPRQSQPKYEK